MTATAGLTVSPFQVHFPQEELADLRQRIATTRFPDREPVGDQSQGVQSATIQALLRYWSTEYDFGRVEKRLNSLPQFMTEIDGLDIHFIHVRSKYDDALPLIVTHGWPGSVIEQLSIVDPLTDPAPHGGSTADAFHLVIPSLPGYGFSGKPQSTGWNPDHIARAWDTLMKRLGYERYLAQGGDWGAYICEIMARQAPEGLLSVHINLLYARPPEIARALALRELAPPDMSEEEKTAYEQLRARGVAGYTAEQATRPQTIGFSLADSPAGLAAWLLDHDERSYEKFAQAFAGHPAGNLTRDEILDNITLYWLTNTGASSGRLYWETKVIALDPADVQTPVAMTVFPDEYVQIPRSWAERAYRNLIYFNKADRGGHFAAWEEPELFATEIRAAFRALR